MEETGVDATSDVVIGGDGRENGHAEDVLDVAIVEHAVRRTHDDESVDVFEARIGDGTTKGQIAGLHHHDVEVALLVHGIGKRDETRIDHGVMRAGVVA